MVKKFSRWQDEKKRDSVRISVGKRGGIKTWTECAVRRSMLSLVPIAKNLLMLMAIRNGSIVPMHVISRIDLVMMNPKQMERELRFRSSYLVLKRMKENELLTHEEFRKMTALLLEKHVAKISSLTLDIT